MTAQVIYMMNGAGPDPAILKGLVDAGCEVRDTHSVEETLSGLYNAESGACARNTILVAEVQAGALPLLSLLHEAGGALPTTLLFDRQGDSIRAVIKALTLGVRDYILASEPDLQRELRARMLVERLLVWDGVRPLKAAQTTVTLPLPVPPRVDSTPDTPFHWDPKGQVIDIQGRCIRLSQVEGRVFDLLLAHHNQPVPIDELIRHGLLRDDIDADMGLKLLRHCMMRLRAKLARDPGLAHCIFKAHGKGYMLILAGAIPPPGGAPRPPVTYGSGQTALVPLARYGDRALR